MKSKCCSGEATNYAAPSFSGLTRSVEYKSSKSRKGSNWGICCTCKTNQFKQGIQALTLRLFTLYMINSLETPPTPTATGFPPSRGEAEDTRSRMSALEGGGVDRYMV